MAPESTRDETPVQRIERITMRKLTMQTSASAKLAKCNFQDQSPLYCKLPKEIRDLIYEFAIAQYQAPPQAAVYHRPGHRAPLPQTATNLLLVCRRTWLDASLISMRKVVVTYWFDELCRPIRLSLHNADRDRWANSNKSHWTTLHVCVQNWPSMATYDTLAAINKYQMIIPPRPTSMLGPALDPGPPALRI